MERRIKIILFTILILTGVIVVGSVAEDKPKTEQQENVDINGILEKVVTQYMSLDNLDIKGTQITRYTENKSEITESTAFEMKLGKPNYFKIIWTKRMPGGKEEKGAIWNSGQEAFIYIGSLKSYFKADSYEMALNSAYGIKRGFAQYIPGMFFYGSGILHSLKDLKFQGIQPVGGEPCYVISGKSMFASNYTFWISKARYLIRKTQYSLDKSRIQYYDQIFNGLIKEEHLIKAMGLDVNEERTKTMGKMINLTREHLNKFETGQVTEIYIQVDPDPKLSRDDYQYSVSKEVQFRDSLYEFLFNNLDNLVK